MASNIVLAKGSISVTIQTVNVNDNFTNLIFIIKPPQSTSNQDEGAKPAKIVDLLRVTHQMVIGGEIVGTASKTATQIKQDLISMWKGAGLTGGPVSLTYDGNASAFGNTAATSTNPLNGYIEKVTCTEVPFDEPDDFVSAKENYTHISKYAVSITFLEGTQI